MPKYLPSAADVIGQALAIVLAGVIVAVIYKKFPQISAFVNSDA